MAGSPGIAESCLYRWKAQDLLARGLKGGSPAVEAAALVAAQKRIADLEQEVKVLKRAAAGIRQWTIWRSGCHLFHVGETGDFEAAMAAVPIAQRQVRRYDEEPRKLARDMMLAAGSERDRR